LLVSDLSIGSVMPDMSFEWTPRWTDGVPSDFKR
jgi:hypothetical protein